MTDSDILQQVLKLIREKDYGGGVTFLRLKNSLRGNDQDIYDAIDELIDKGKITEIKKGCFQATGEEEPEKEVKEQKKAPEKKPAEPVKSPVSGFMSFLKVMGGIFLILIAIPFFYGLYLGLTGPKIETYFYVVKPVNNTLYYLVDGSLYLDKTYLGTTTNGTLIYGFRNCQPGKLHFYPDFGEVNYEISADFNCENKSIIDITPYYDELNNLAIATSIARMTSSSSEIRETAINITSGCADRDIACEVTEIYKRLLLNIKYIKDPVGQPIIQYPEYTMQIDSGDYDDFTILSSSLLQSIGIRTKVVVGKDRTYNLICGLDLNTLLSYDNIDYREFYAYYYSEDKLINAGADESVGFFENADYGEYSWTGYIQSDYYFDIDTITTYLDYLKYKNGEVYIHYPGLSQKNTKYFEVDSLLPSTAGFVISNSANSYPISVYYYLKYSPNHDFLKKSDLSSYTINNEICVPFDASYGKYGYVGLDTISGETGKRLVLDTYTNNYSYI